MNSSQQPKIHNREAAFITFRNLKSNNQTILFPPQQTQNTRTEQTQLINPSPQYWQSLTAKGKQQLQDKKIMSVVIFVGGMGSRSQVDDGKQFKQLTGGLSLFSKALYLARNQQNCVKTIYVIVNKKNALKIAQSIKSVAIDFDGIQVSIAGNTQAPLLDQYGIQRIYRKENTKLTFPDGIGNFLQSKMFFSEGEDLTIESHLKMTGVQYLYCYGISNQFEPGIDYALIGMLAQNNSNNIVVDQDTQNRGRRPKKISTVFKYMPSNESQHQYQRILLYQFLNKQKQWLVMETESLLKISNNHSAIFASPFWMNNFAIDLRIYEKIKSQNHQSLELSSQILPRKLKNKQGHSIMVNVYEKTISSTVMPHRSRCIGICARVGEKFVPKIYHQQFQQSKQAESSVDQSIRKSKSRLKRK